MKILYYGVFDGQPWRAEYPMAEGLRLLGYNLFCSNYRVEKNIVSDWNKYKKEANLIFIQNGKGFKPEYLKMFDIPVVFFASEARLSDALPILTAERRLDFVIAHSAQTMGYCLIHNIPAVRLHNGFNENFYFRTEDPYKYPVSFVGHSSPRRNRFFEFLEKKHIPLKLFSSAAPNLINRVYNQSKIVLHCHMIEETYLPTRLFEVMPTRGCLLTENIGENYDPALGKGFFEAFSSKQELYEKIMYLLGNEDYRLRLVAEANRLAPLHTWKERMEDFSLIFQGVLK